MWWARTAPYRVGRLRNAPCGLAFFITLYPAKTVEDMARDHLIDLQNAAAEIVASFRHQSQTR